MRRAARAERRARRDGDGRRLGEARRHLLRHGRLVHAARRRARVPRGN